MYTQRRDGLAKGKEGTPEMAAYTEGELKKLNDKFTRLVEITRIASEQYYETEEFANAYKVLVPAVNSQSEIIKNILKSSVMPIIAVEALTVVFLIVAAFIYAIKEENGKNAVKKKADGPDDDDDDDDSDEKETEAKEKEVKEEKKTEEKSGDKKNSGKAKNNNK